MEILVLLMPVVLLMPLGMLAGAALAHWVSVWLALALAGGLAVAAIALVWTARGQIGFDGIGNVILGVLFAAPLALGVLLGAGLMIWRRRRSKGI